MELVTKKRLHLLSGRSNLPLAEEIAEYLGVELGHPNLAEFSNGEIHSKPLPVLHDEHCRILRSIDMAEEIPGSVTHRPHLAGSGPCHRARVRVRADDEHS